MCSVVACEYNIHQTDAQGLMMLQSGAKSASKQAPKQPSSPFSFFGGKSGGTGKVKANQVGNTAKVKAGQVGRTAKIKAGAAKQNAQSAPKKVSLGRSTAVNECAIRQSNVMPCYLDVEMVYKSLHFRPDW